MTYKIRTYVLLTGGAWLAALPLLTPQIARAQDAVPAPPVVKPDAKQDAATTKPDDMQPITWAIEYKKGSVKQTRLNATITGDGGVGAITIGFKQMQKRVVKEVKPDGGAIIEVTQLSQSIVFNDQELAGNADAHPVTTLTLDKNGLLLDYKASEDLPGGDAAVRLAALLAIVPVPSKPVKFGESWTSDYSNKMLGKQKVTITYTLLGRDVTLGKQTLKIKAQGVAPIGEDGKEVTKINAIINLEPEKANIVRAVFKIENLDIPGITGGAMKGSIDATVEQIIPGVNDKEEKKK